LKVLEEGVKLGLKGVKIHPLIEKCPANDKEKSLPPNGIRAKDHR